MANITLSKIVGGGGLPQLAPDLTYPSSLLSNNGFIQITGINAVGSLTTALSLTGKFAISLLNLSLLTVETITIKLTVDGEVVWNDTLTAPVNFYLLGSSNTANTTVASEIQCKNSLLLEIQTATDPSVSLNYLARPIL